MSLASELKALLANAQSRKTALAQRQAEIATDLDECEAEIGALEILLPKVMVREGRAAAFGAPYTNGAHNDPPVQRTPGDLSELEQAIMLAVGEHPEATAAEIAEAIIPLGFDEPSKGIGQRLTRLRNLNLVIGTPVPNAAMTYTLPAQEVR